jgi:hypothetical protein
MGVAGAVSGIILAAADRFMFMAGLSTGADVSWAKLVRIASLEPRFLWLAMQIRQISGRRLPIRAYVGEWSKAVRRTRPGRLRQTAPAP